MTAPAVACSNIQPKRGIQQMAQVHDNGMVAHIWANQSQECARSHNGNFWFEGRAIYSYRTPIANLVDGATGLVALVTCETFSVTTSGKHMPAIHRATDYGRSVPTHTVPSIGASGGRLSGLSGVVDHDANMAHLIAIYEKAKARVRRARDLWGSVASYLEHDAKAAFAYSESFGLPAPAIDLAADAAAIETFRAERNAENNTPDAIAKRERDRERRAERKAEKERRAAEIARIDAAEKRASWIAGENVFLGYGAAAECERGGALLRVKGDNLETSMRATVPLEHAIKAFRFQKLVRETGQAWARNGRTIRVGHFQVDRIEANGDMRAGCHFITWEESERIARELGVFDQAASDEAAQPSGRAA
jgi:hypothetical protein